jgi:hypothetical protein
MSIKGAAKPAAKLASLMAAAAASIEVLYGVLQPATAQQRSWAGTQRVVGVGALRDQDAVFQSSATASEL